MVLNYRFRDAAAASKVPRRDVTLRQCRACGLVFNATFDGSLIPYDQFYENRQHHSPTFTAHLERLAADLTGRNALTGGQILEVGCGKGDFLRLICRVARGSGDGYDTSFEPDSAPEAKGVEFHARYVSAADIQQRYDAVICRHVVEHVPEIGPFLKELSAIARAAGDPVVVIETPRFEWIVENLCLWDIFYEHCNYFPVPTLAHLCRLAGFRVARHRSAFGGQYQVLELRVARRAVARLKPGIPAAARLDRFAAQARKSLDALAKKLTSLSAGQGWGLWGAGAKGVALANQLESTHPALVIDVNPAKQGGVLPGTRIPILSPDNPQIDRLGLILIANPNYAVEIRAALAQRGFAGQTLTL